MTGNQASVNSERKAARHRVRLLQSRRMRVGKVKVGLPVLLTWAKTREVSAWLQLGNFFSGH